MFYPIFSLITNMHIHIAVELSVELQLRNIHLY